MSDLRFDDNNNSIATILKRKKLYDDLYQFTFDKVVIGRVDNKGVFTDTKGISYYPINNPKFLNYRNNKVYSRYLHKVDLSLVFSLEEDLSENNLINQYERYIKDVMFLVKVEKDKKDNIKLLIKDVSINRIRDSFGLYDEDDYDDYYIEDVITDVNRTERYLDDDYIENNSFMRNMSKLIMDTYNCEFNTKELFKMFNNLCYVKTYLNSALDTIDLQLQAYHDKDAKPNNPEKTDEEFTNSEYHMFDVFNEENDGEVIDLIEYIKKNRIGERMDLIALRDEIKKYLINQDEALRRVLVEIARMDIKDDENNKGILLLGDSGVGKTYLMELLAENLDVPILIVDSTQLTVPGYVGKDIQEYLWDLYEKCDRDLEKCEHAIVFFDEIDKKGSNRKSDTSGQGVLNVLLKFLDGTVYDVCRDTKKSSEIVKMDTSHMKVIAGGAFTDVFTKEKKNSIGFNPIDNSKEDKTIPDADTFVQKAFMTHEFMGRFPIRIRLNPHTVDSFKTILTESNSSTLKEEEKAFKKLGIKLSVTDEFITLASSEALKLKTGVRGLMGCIEEATWMAFEDCYNNPDKYEEIILTEETLKDPANYQKVLKK